MSLFKPQASAPKITIFTYVASVKPPEMTAPTQCAVGSDTLTPKENRLQVRGRFSP